MRSRIAWGPLVRLYKLHTAHPLSHWVWQGKAWLREAAMAFPYCVCFRRNLGSALASDRTIGEKFKLRHYPVLSPCPVESNDLDISRRLQGERRFRPAALLLVLGTPKELGGVWHRLGAARHERWIERGKAATASAVERRACPCRMAAGSASCRPSQPLRSSQDRPRMLVS